MMESSPLCSHTLPSCLFIPHSCRLFALTSFVSVSGPLYWLLPLPGMFLVCTTLVSQLKMSPQDHFIESHSLSPALLWDHSWLCCEHASLAEKTDLLALPLLPGSGRGFALFTTNA